MKKVILVFLFFIGVALNAAEFNMPQYESPLISVEDGEGSVMDSPLIMVGSSGVVMHKFPNGNRSIVARAVVTEKKGNFAKIRFEVFGVISLAAFKTFSNPSGVCA